MNFKNNSAIQNFTQNYKPYRGANGSEGHGNSQEPKQAGTLDSRSKNQKIV